MRRFVLPCAALGVAAHAAFAGITPTLQIRHVRATGMIFGAATMLNDDVSFQAPDFGVFDDTATVDLTLEGSIVQSSADQLSTIGNHKIYAELDSGAVIVSSPTAGAVQASGQNTAFIMFQVSQPQTWRLDAVIPRTNGSAFASVVIRRGGTIVAMFDGVSGPGETHQFVQLQPGEYAIEIDASADASMCGGPFERHSEAAIGVHFSDVSGACAGDADGDRRVTFADLNRVLAVFGAAGTIGFVEGDLNFDGSVNFLDLNLVLGAFSQTCP